MLSDPANSSIHRDEDHRQVTKEEEFIHLLMAAYRSMYLYARTLVPSADDAEECVQEASLQLWKKFDEFNRDGSFAHWARGFIRRVVKNFHRKARPRYLALDEDLIDKLASIQGGAQELLDLRRERLAVCLNKLSPQDRQLVKSYYEHGESVTGLAKLSGRTAAAIYQSLHRARLMLFRCVDRNLRKED